MSEEAYHTHLNQWGPVVEPKARKKRAPKPGQRQAITRSMVTARKTGDYTWEVTLKEGGKRLGTIERVKDWRGTTYSFTRSSFWPLMNKRSKKNTGATQMNLAVIALIGGK